MAPKVSNKQQSEEDLLLQDFSRNLSTKSTALFYANALIVSAIPICEYFAAVNCFLQLCHAVKRHGGTKRRRILFYNYNEIRLVISYK